MNWFFDNYMELLLCVKHMGTDDEKESMSKLMKLSKYRFDVKSYHMAEIVGIVRKYKAHVGAIKAE